MKAIFFLFLFFPLALQAQIYHCSSPDGPIYSQIPCEDNAEKVAIRNSRIMTDDGDAAGPEPRQEPEAVEVTPTDRLNAFIATLEKQREAHIGQIDRNIKSMRQQMASDDFASTDDVTKKEFSRSLFDLKLERYSICRLPDGASIWSSNAGVSVVRGATACM